MGRVWVQPNLSEPLHEEMVVRTEAVRTANPNEANAPAEDVDY